MIGVNLIPTQIVEAHRRSRRIRWWLGVVVVVGGVSALPVLWQVRQHTRAARLMQRKSELTRQTAQVREELAELAKKLTALDERIERANALRTKRSWASLLSMVTACMPEQMWLVGMNAAAGPSGAPGNTGRGPSGKQEAQPQVVVLDGARRLDLVGYAVEHEQVYDFMTRLKESGAFGQVDLTKADTEDILSSQAVRFELVCSW